MGPSKICKKYDDECFTQIGEFDILRGCLSDRSPYFEESCRKDEAKCSICSSSEEKICNDKPIEMELCIQCDAIEDEKCQNQPDLYKGKICNTINSTDREGCYLNTVSY